jgi:hypothetical protein
MLIKPHSGMWGRVREEKHARMYPPEEKTERNRQAQVRFRERHAAVIADAREAFNILSRSRDHNDAKRLARILRKRLMSSERKALIAELRRLEQAS